MLTRSIWALVIGLIGIFIYLTFRFEMPFAIGGIVAIFHDVLIAVGVCALCGKEIGLILIGAFLTIAGYSINDTIVIFDRVRENLRTKKGDLKEILNQSISDTLSRTIITSSVTGLAVLAMYLFGGKAMALIGGVIQEPAQFRFRKDRAMADRHLPDGAALTGHDQRPDIQQNPLRRIMAKPVPRLGAAMRPADEPRAVSGKERRIGTEIRHGGGAQRLPCGLQGRRDHASASGAGCRQTSIIVPRGVDH